MAAICRLKAHKRGQTKNDRHVPLPRSTVKFDKTQ